jgi:hypothetical protein
VVGDVAGPVASGVIVVVIVPPTGSDGKLSLLELKPVVFPSAKARLKLSVGALPTFSISIV